MIRFNQLNWGIWDKTYKTRVTLISGSDCMVNKWTLLVHRMEEPDRLQSMGFRRVWTWLSDFPFIFHFHALEKEMATHSSILAWRTPGMGEPVGMPSMWSHRVGHDWSGLAAAAAAAHWKKEKDGIVPEYHNFALPTMQQTSIWFVQADMFRSRL